MDKKKSMFCSGNGSSSCSAFSLSFLLKSATTNVTVESLNRRGRDFVGRIRPPENHRYAKHSLPQCSQTAFFHPAVKCLFDLRTIASLNSKTWPSDLFGAFRRIRPQRPNSVPFPASQTSSIVPPPLLTPSPLLAVNPLLLHLCPSVFPWRRRRRRRRPLASMQCHTPPTIPDWPSVRTSGEDRRRASVPLGRNRPTEGLFEGGSAAAGFRRERGRRKSGGVQSQDHLRILVLCTVFVRM